MQHFVAYDRCGARIGFGQRDILCIVVFGRAELLVTFRSSLLS